MRAINYTNSFYDTQNQQKMLRSTAIRCNNSLHCLLPKPSTLPQINPNIKELKSMNLEHNERQFVFCRHREGGSLMLSLDNPKFDLIPRCSDHHYLMIQTGMRTWGTWRPPFRSHNFFRAPSGSWLQKYNQAPWDQSSLLCREVCWQKILLLKEMFSPFPREKEA